MIGLKSFDYREIMEKAKAIRESLKVERLLEQGWEFEWDEILWKEEYAPLIATICDQQINAEDAWNYPKWLYGRIGSLDPQNLLRRDHRKLLEEYLKDKWPKGMSREDKEDYLERIPRYIKQALKFFIKKGYSPISMFDNRAYQALEVYFMLRIIPGIGHKKASMITRDFIYRSKGYTRRHPWFDQIKERYPRFEVVGEHLLDMPIDVHVVKVFNRLFGRNAKNWRNEIQRSTPDILAFSKLVYPEFPAKLDQVFWTIGHEYCDERNPDCTKCPLNDICEFGRKRLERG